MESLFQLIAFIMREYKIGSESLGNEKNKTKNVHISLQSGKE